MDIPIIQFQRQGFSIESLTPDLEFDVWPEIGYPHGRPALILSNSWKHLRRTGVKGVLLLGHDVVADPDDHQAMVTSAGLQPASVHTGLMKLWPPSTGCAEWEWSHRGGSLGKPESSQLDIIHPAYFSLGFTFLPRQLMDLAFPANDNWGSDGMAVGLSEIALQANIRTIVVYDAMPKHVHFTMLHVTQSGGHYG
jgi:hypothetical protein